MWCSDRVDLELLNLVCHLKECIELGASYQGPDMVVWLSMGYNKCYVAQVSGIALFELNCTK